MANNSDAVLVEGSQAPDIIDTIAIEACTLRRVPFELRTLIFEGVRDERVAGASDLVNLVVALSGDKQLRNEIIDFMCKKLALYVSPCRFESNWIESHVPKNIVERIRTLHLRVWDYSFCGHLYTDQMPMAIRWAKSVNHVHLDPEGAPYTVIFEILTDWVLRIGVIKKLSGTFHSSYCEGYVISKLNAAFGIIGIEFDKTNNPGSFMWETADGSDLVFRRGRFPESESSDSSDS